jgi:hypothetical protein
VLSGLTIVPVSAGALVAIVVVLVLTGNLVPRRTLMDARAEAERWMHAWQLEHEARQRYLEHAEAGLEAARTTTAVLQSLPIAAEGGSGEHAVVS